MTALINLMITHNILLKSHLNLLHRHAGAYTLTFHKCLVSTVSAILLSLIFIKAHGHCCHCHLSIKQNMCWVWKGQQHAQ